jgi:tetratricopeptide (TPR) repeat protein
MSPEQSTGEQAIDGRSDIYSLGCVLYEMLAGEPPFTGPTAQAILAKRLSEALPRVSVVRESVPAAVEAALARALARVPADRYATAQQFAAALTPPWQFPIGGPIARARGRRIRIGVLASLVVVAFGVLGGIRLLSSSGIDFAARDWIVVTDVDNRTGDSVFEGSLGDAFLIGLQQSRYVNVLWRLRVVEILQQMQRPDTTRLDEAVGREVALRANVRVLVVPAISRIDSTYLLTTRIVDVPTGIEVLTRSERAGGREGVLTALDGLARQLRRDLGESRRAVAQNDVHLDDATTPSLEALRAWTEGNRYWNARRFTDAAERYRQALGLDSSFAMAHKMLGEYHFWQARRDSSEYHFGRALSVLDRVTERERLRIQSAFYGARANWEAAIRAQETYIARYPDDRSERYNLGSAYMRAGRYQDAIRTLRQVVEADSAHVWALINLATSYGLNGAYAEALPYYRRAFALRPEFRLSGNLNHELGVTFEQLGQLDSAEATFTPMLAGSSEQQAQGHRSLALLRMYEGRYADARSHLERAIALTRALRAPVSEFRNRLYLAATYASTGQTRAFSATLRQAAATADELVLGPVWLRRLAAGYAQLGDTVALGRLVALIAQRVSEGSTEDRAARAHAEGQLALSRGDYEHATALLEEAVLVAGPLSDESRPVLALAHRLSGDAVKAESTYLAVIATRGSLGWEPQEAWILAHYELGRIYQERGDTANAVDAYGQFLAFWSKGDSNLVALADARKRLRTLVGPD